MAMKSASLCLGIRTCECVDVMYSTGMCTHMAMITQHTHMQRCSRNIMCPKIDQCFAFKATVAALIGCLNELYALA